MFSPLLSLRERHLVFWNHTPTLLGSLSILAAHTSALYGSSLSSFCLLVLWGLYLVMLRRFLFLVLTCGVFLVSFVWSSSLPHFSSPESVSSSFTIRSFHTPSTPFSKRISCTGHLSTEKGSILCRASLPSEVSIQELSHVQSLLIRGLLKESSPYQYTLQVDTLKAVSFLSHPSIPWIRWTLKKRLGSFFASTFSSPKIASFFQALISGEGIDPSLRFHLGQVGVQHLLAVSGFHFGALLYLLSLLLNRIGSPFVQRMCLLGFILLYTLFIGPSHSVERSALACFLFVLSTLLYRPRATLHWFALVLIQQIFFDPLSPTHLAFQLSFSSVLGILLFFPPFETFLSFWIPQRSKEEWAALSYFQIPFAFLAKGLKGALAVTVSVLFFVLPLLLFHFQWFPWISLFYNLFFPAMTSLSLYLCLLSCLSYLCLPPLAPILFSWTETYTSSLLSMAEHPLPFLQIGGSPLSISPVVLQVTLFLSLFLGVSLDQREANPLKSGPIAWRS